MTAGSRFQVWLQVADQWGAPFTKTDPGAGEDSRLYWILHNSDAKEFRDCWFPVRSHHLKSEGLHRTDSG